MTFDFRLYVRNKDHTVTSMSLILRSSIDGRNVSIAVVEALHSFPDVSCMVHF
jgi:hypothetical protein